MADKDIQRQNQWHEQVKYINDNALAQLTKLSHWRPGSILSAIVVGILLGLFNTVFVAFPLYWSIFSPIRFDAAKPLSTAVFTPLSGWWVTREDTGEVLVRGQGQESIVSIELPQGNAYHLSLFLTHLPVEPTGSRILVYLNEALLGELKVPVQAEAQRFELYVPAQMVKENANNLRFVYPAAEIGVNTPNNIRFNAIELQKALTPWLFLLIIGQVSRNFVWQVPLWIVFVLAWRYRQQLWPTRLNPGRVIEVPSFDWKNAGNKTLYFFKFLNQKLGNLKQLIPSLQHKTLTYVTFGVFLIVIAGYLPKLLDQAEIADLNTNHSVPTVGDDSSYTVAAINLLNGLGFADTISLPLETYRLDLTTPLGVYYQQTYAAQGPVAPEYSFYRAPGFPFLLSGAYALFGTETIVARRLLAILTWLTALLIVALGFYLAGWVGSLAGGVTALYHLNYFSDAGVPTFERILTEIPTAFWIVLFGFLFSIYLSKRRWPILLGAVAALTCAILTRSNFLLVLPFLLIYLYFRHRHLPELLLVGMTVVLPVGMWSLYASITLGQPVAVTTQGEVAFPQFNNLDVLEGVGPQRALQGGWNPGFDVDSNGNLTLPNPYRHASKPGENGWVKGLTFWRENLSRLPELFYLKLWANFWYDRGTIKNYLQPEGIYLVGIGILLMALGLRQPGRLAHLDARYALLFQLGLILLLFIFWNSAPFWLILFVWGLILLVAWLRPYGDYYQLAKPSPTWFLVFVAGYAFVTILFGDPRFHHPLDPLLMLFGTLGTLLILYELIKRNWLLMLSFLTVVVGATLSRFDYI